MEFGRMYGLLLIPLVILFLWFTSKRVKVSGRKDIFPVISRCIILMLLIFAFTDITLHIKGKNVATVFLLDLSDSVMDFKEEGIKFINESLKNIPSKNKSGVVVFGENVEIDKFLDDKKEYLQVSSIPIVNSTNIQEGIQSAVSLFPQGSSKRIVLITDGEENQGDMLKTLPLIKEGNIDLKVYKIDNGESNEVYVDEVKVPENINIGEEFSIITTIDSNIKTKATLTLFSGREKKGNQVVEIEKGRNTFVFKDIQNTGGFKGYRVTISADEDTQLGNNEYTCYTNVRAIPQILVIEGSEGEAKGIDSVLNSGNSDYKIITPGSAPRTINDFLEYKSIVLSNVHVDDLNNGFMENVESYVKEYGGGVVVTGGEDSYALGGYKDTSLETILPVNVDKKGKNEIPQISLTLVIDKSGSMSSDGSNVSKLTLAKEAAMKALDNLRSVDEIGVIAFDDQYSWAVERQHLNNKDQIKEDIASIGLGGGTSIYPALKEAYESQIKSSAKIKHIILLTDGQDGFAESEYSDIVDGMKENNITLSTVSVGLDANGSLLEYLAEQGKGRNYSTNIYTDIPRIFAKEVLLSTGVYLINGEFTPTLRTSHEVLNSVVDDGKMPSLLGYVGTSIKPQAIEVLSSHEDEPILALWQYGLGRVVAWTSDASGQWSRNLLSSAKGGQLFKNIIDWSIPSYEDGGKLTIAQDGSTAKVEFESEVIDENNVIKGIYTAENGEEGELELEQVQPGKYTAKVKLKDLGFYNFNIREEKNGETLGNYNGAFALQYSPEYKFNTNSEKLDSLVEESKGEFIRVPSEVFTGESKNSYKKINLTTTLLVFAMLLFFFDIIYRRLNLDFNKYFSKLNFKGVSEKLVKDNKEEKAETNKNWKITNSKKSEKDVESQIQAEKEMELDKNKPISMKGKNNSKEKNNDTKGNRLDTAALLKKKQDRNQK